MAEHHGRLMGAPPSTSQRDAWIAEHEVMVEAVDGCLLRHREAPSWKLIFEYELPLEGGRRPDVTVLSGGSISVLEFKSTTRPAQPQLDQVAAYARDLADYHEASHRRRVTPFLVLPGAPVEFAQKVGDVVATGRSGLGEYLVDASDEGDIDLPSWLNSPYAPLPTLVAAAQRIFRHERLPHVRYALAAGIPETLDLIGEVVTEAAQRGQRAMIFVTGVPGAGKTLVGLRFVYERTESEGRGILLSGNGPLVQVLQHALKSREFVRDLHAYIRTYGINERVPKEQVVVFDEAQRAWDRDYMRLKRGVDKSEPELLVEAGERIPSWSALVGLVGEGQHIYSGEEAGMPGWREALERRPPGRWHVHCPPHLEPDFAGLDVRTHDRLHLEVVLRARRAEEIHDWVKFLLDGSLAFAARKAARFQGHHFEMYVTRDLQDAKNYALARYPGEPDKRYGLIASSHSKVQQSYGVDNGFLATRKIKVGPWFNAPPADPLSGCALEQPITEFHCQGLELDLPLLCWGEDMTWDGTRWEMNPKRRQYAPKEPEDLLRNTYRVLLTRGRDGLVVWVPPEDRFDRTEHALLAAGVRPLEDVEAVEEFAGNGS